MSSGRTQIAFLSLAIGIVLPGASSVAKAATAYVATGGGAFGTIDLDSGVFTQLGLTNVPVVGLALVGTTLYADGQGTGNNRGQLYSVNPATGALMSIGSPAGIDFTAFGSCRGTLYALDHNSANANLYSINSSTGAATLIGPTNTGQPLAGYWTLSTNSTSLYFSLNSNLYTLNTSTGQATVVGGLGSGIQVGAIAEVGGVLYAGQDNPQPPLKIVTLNKGTGAATVLSDVTNSPGSNISYIYALSPTIQATSVLPHFAVGGSYVTGFTVVNTGSQVANFSISFHDGNGNPVSLPFAGLGTLEILSDTIAANGTKYYEAGTPQGTSIVGSGIVTADPTITIQALFRRLGSNNSYYEVAVAASTGVNEFEIPFDDTTFAATGDQIYTGFAIANLDTVNSTSVTCTARDATGATIPGAISVPALNPMGHWAGYLFPALIGQRGTLDCASDTKTGAIGIRALGTNGISSLPVIALR
jgi:hypothetical protein